MKVFDAHSDIWSDVTAHRLAGGTSVLRRRHMDRLAKGGVEGSIFVIWVDPPYDAAPMARTRDIMAAVRAELGEDGAVTVVHTYEEMMAARDAGKFYVFIGIEGLAAIGEDLERIDWYYEFGARHAGLTWNEANALATGVNGDPGRGLTGAGRAAVRKIQVILGRGGHCGSPNRRHPLQLPGPVRCAAEPDGRAAAGHPGLERRGGAQRLQRLCGPGPRQAGRGASGPARGPHG